MKEELEDMIERSLGNLLNPSMRYHMSVDIRHYIKDLVSECPKEQNLKKFLIKELFGTKC